MKAQNLGVEFCNCRNPDHFDYMPNKHRVRDYCSSIQAAWEIVLGNLMQGFNLEYFEDKKKWRASFREEYAVCDCDDGHDTEVTYFEEEADTAPMAICLAFLKLP